MDNRNKIQFIRSEYLQGRISLNEAKSNIEPILKVINETGEKIAKEHGKKWKKLTFNYIFR